MGKRLKTFILFLCFLLLFGSYVMFEYGEIIECLEFADSFLANKIDATCFARKFPTMVRKIKDDDFSEFTIGIRGKCKKFKDCKIDEQELIESAMLFAIESKRMYGFLNYSPN